MFRKSQKLLEINRATAAVPVNTELRRLIFTVRRLETTLSAETAQTEPESPERDGF